MADQKGIQFVYRNYLYVPACHPLALSSLDIGDLAVLKGEWKRMTEEKKRQLRYLPSFPSPGCNMKRIATTESNNFDHLTQRKLDNICWLMVMCFDMLNTATAQQLFAYCE